jgi:hypothetical protein
MTRTAQSWNKKIKSFFVPSTSRFVFQLFMDHQLSEPLGREVINTVSNKKFRLPPPLLAPAPVPLVQLVMDVPDYLGVAPALPPEPFLKMKTVSQYNGFLVDLTGHADANSYMVHFLSTRNRKNLLSKKRKLEQLHSISYRTYFGEMAEDTYHLVLDAFYELLKKRFREKKAYNKNLGYWEAYKQVVLPLLLQKKASLFVIYDGERPITITLNFHLEDMVFSYIQTYDTAYSKYNMGDISMLNHLEWCTGHGISLFDLSMGATDYKIKWCNRTYNFKYLLFYRKNSIPAWILATFTEAKLRLKQYLRDKGVLGKIFQYDRFAYKVRTVFAAFRRRLGKQ